MHYLTHALSPMLSLLQTTAATVTCRGAGRLADHRQTGGFDNPYPCEVALVTLRGSAVLADITMAFSQVARSYIEGFSLYGDRRGIEWPIDNVGPLRIFDLSGPAEGHRGNQVSPSELDPPDVTESLPESIRQFVRPTEVQLPGMPAAVSVGADHGGSHPFLVHEFVSSIVENRAPLIDAATAAAWTAPGICAHESALAGGIEIEVPSYD